MRSILHHKTCSKDIRLKSTSQDQTSEGTRQGFCISKIQRNADQFTTYNKKVINEHYFVLQIKVRNVNFIIDKNSQQT